MEFKKQKSTKYVAKGEYGTFVIQKSRGLWWGQCIHKTSAFNLPPKRKLKDAMAICRENYYWE